MSGPGFFGRTVMLRSILMRYFGLLAFGLLGVGSVGCQTTAGCSACDSQPVSPCAAAVAKPACQTDIHCQQAKPAKVVCTDCCPPTPTLMQQLQGSSLFGTSRCDGCDRCGRRQAAGCCPSVMKSSCQPCSPATPVAPAETERPAQLPATVQQPCPCVDGKTVVVHQIATSPAAPVELQPVSLTESAVGTATAAELPAPTQAAGEQQIMLGVLHFNPRNKIWRLRYVAAGDDDDAQGGVVTLRGVEPFAHQLKSGMTVSVRGGLVHSQTKSLAPDFAVSEVRLVNE
jgi:hypothetical protein